LLRDGIAEHVVDSQPENVELAGVMPVLVTATWCPYTASAASFWGDAAESVGQPLRIVDLATAEGEQVARAVRLQGVPCLVAPDGKLHYGLGLSNEQAEQLLHERQVCQ
jgi:hypothetical protein